MHNIDEKRIFAEKTTDRVAYIAADVGLLTVRLAEDRVGNFGITQRCSPEDIAVYHNQVALAAEDVYLGDADGIEPTNFGASVAVGDGSGLLTASPGGTLAQYDADPPHWESIGKLSSVTAIEGDLIGTESGIYRLPELTDVGLDRVRDIDTTGVPLAATQTGLYRLGNGWMDDIDGDFHMVSSPPARDYATYAATPNTCYKRHEGEWHPLELSTTEPIVDAAFGDCPYLLAADGTLLANAGEGWRSHPLGVTGAVGIAIPERKTV